MSTASSKKVLLRHLGKNGPLVNAFGLGTMVPWIFFFPPFFPAIFILLRLFFSQ